MSQTFTVIGLVLIAGVIVDIVLRLVALKAIQKNGSFIGNTGATSNSSTTGNPLQDAIKKAKDRIRDEYMQNEQKKQEQKEALIKFLTDFSLDDSIYQNLKHLQEVLAKESRVEWKKANIELYEGWVSVPREIGTHTIGSLPVSYGYGCMLHTHYSVEKKRGMDTLAGFQYFKEVWTKHEWIGILAIKTIDDGTIKLCQATMDAEESGKDEPVSAYELSQKKPYGWVIRIDNHLMLAYEEAKGKADEVAIRQTKEAVRHAYEKAILEDLTQYVKRLLRID